MAEMWTSESQIRKSDCLFFVFFLSLLQHPQKIICQMYMIISTYFQDAISITNNGEQYVESPEKIIHYRLTNVM